MSGKFHVQSPTQNSFVIDGSFAVDGSNVPTDLKGAGYSAAAGGTGEYVLTLADPFVEVISAVGTVQLATAAGKFAEVTAISVANKTITFTLWLAGTGAQALGSTTGNRFNFSLCLR